VISDNCFIDLDRILGQSRPATASRAFEMPQKNVFSGQYRTWDGLWWQTSLDTLQNINKQ